MISRFLLCLVLCCLMISAWTTSADTMAANTLSSTANGPIDLEATMKKMGLALKNAREAASPQAAKPYLSELTTLVTRAKTASFPADKAQSYVAGLDKVLLSLAKAATAADTNNEPQLKLALAEVEDLRKHYHKQRKVSFWQLLFG